METIIVEWFKVVPQWTITTISIILILLIIGISVAVWLGVFKFSQAMGKENTIISLKESVNSLEKQLAFTAVKASQLQTVTMNARSYIISMNSMIGNSDGTYFHLIQRIVEAIASDIKSSGIERHRCGFWLYEKGNEGDEYLELYNGSSGFPHSYINIRTLDLNDSIAGRAYRKKQTINLSDVTSDADWSSVVSSGTYGALICIPVAEFGVLTIDAKEPMDESIQSIGELYASIIEGLFSEMIRSLDRSQHERDYDNVTELNPVVEQVAITEE